MEVFGLVAEGYLTMNGKFYKLHSRILYRTEKEAYANADDFKKRCTEESPFNLSAKMPVEIRALKFELKD